MINISQLTALISAFRVETEKESISPENNIIRVWKETLQQYRFLYDIQQRSVEDHCTKLFSSPCNLFLVTTPTQAFAAFTIPDRVYFNYNS